MNITLLHGDCREQLQSLIDQGIQVDSIVTDPPYEMGFMNKSWDGTGIANDIDMWKLCLKVLKPGGHLLSFGGTRTYHRMTCAIEDAGFEIRDCVNWIYGSGFPKSLDVSKAIDKMAGADREIVGEIHRKSSDMRGLNGLLKEGKADIVCKTTTPSTDEAKQWSGFGTALKPAHEPIVLARKPLSEKNIASNVLKHGVGGINIDGCRVNGKKRHPGNYVSDKPATQSIGKYGISDRATFDSSIGRFPANVIHDGSDEVEAEFAKYGDRKSGALSPYKEKGTSWYTSHDIRNVHKEKSTGSASRFFYCAKASKRERNIGLTDKEQTTTDDGRDKPIDNPFQRGETLRHNNHPTVKPIALMKYLCRLITPPGGTVLDPFLGSGSTGIAAKEEGFSFIGIEKESDYMEIAKARIGGLNES